MRIRKSCGFSELKRPTLIRLLQTPSHGFQRPPGLWRVEGGAPIPLEVFFWEGLSFRILDRMEYGLNNGYDKMSDALSVGQYNRSVRHFAVRSRRHVKAAFSGQ
ncbi:hypothetical protein CCP2SC5_580015 [Azospirillaceae bacterium]